MKCNLLRTELSLGYAGSTHGRELNMRFVLHHLSHRTETNCNPGTLGYELKNEKHSEITTGVGKTCCDGDRDIVSSCFSTSAFPG